jgi:hypothetical protein
VREKGQTTFGSRGATHQAPFLFASGAVRDLQHRNSFCWEEDEGGR